MSGGVGGWASCDVPGVESGDVFGSVREKRLFAGDGALGENWASCSDRLGSNRPEKPRRPRTGAASGDASRLLHERFDRSRKPTHRRLLCKLCKSKPHHTMQNL